MCASDTRMPATALFGSFVEWEEFQFSCECGHNYTEQHIFYKSSDSDGDRVSIDILAVDDANEPPPNKKIKRSLYFYYYFIFISIKLFQDTLNHIGK